VTDKPQLVHEVILDQLQAAAATILAQYAEPDAILIVVPWRVGQNEFPFGTIATRPEDRGRATVPQAKHYLEQLNKMMGYVAGNLLGPPFSALAAEFKEAIDDKDNKIKQLREEIAKYKAAGSAPGGHSQ
jgi:hypothetical protein